MFDPGVFLTGEGLASLASLTALEIVLGIDNIVFIAVVSERIEPRRRAALRRTGLGLALVMRLGLLGALSWLMGLTRSVLVLHGHQLSGRDLVLLGGGLFLIAKAAHELFLASEVEGGAAPPGAGAAGGGHFGLLLAQILALDLVFSLDSVITAVGMARQIAIMVVAMVLAVAVMLTAAGAISGFINRHPSMKVLALSFLLMVGALLVGDAFDQHIPRGYVYFAMIYALGVELLNIRRRGRAARKPTQPA